MVFIRVFPSLAKELKIQFIQESVRIFFSKIIIETMEEREKRSIVRHDMINILMQLRRGKLSDEQLHNVMDDSAGYATVEESDIGKKTITRQWTDKELISQVKPIMNSSEKLLSKLILSNSHVACLLNRPSYSSSAASRRLRQY